LKNYLLLLFAIAFFIGCSVKMDPTSINKEILPQKSDNVTEYLASKTYYTYDEKESKITTYFFKEKNSTLIASYIFDYIPKDISGQLYSPISKVYFTIKRLTNGKANTIEEALVMEVKKNGFTKLFNDKEEYILGNDFANDLTHVIREFNDMVERQERRVVILPKL